MTATTEFTHYLDTARAFDDGPRVLSLTQLLALKLGVSVVLALTAKTMGAGWGGALLVGGLGGASALIVTVIAVVHLWPVLSAWWPRRLPVPERPDRVAYRHAMIMAWEADAQLETVSARPAAAHWHRGAVLGLPSAA